MSVVNFKKLKEVSQKARETHLVDLGKYIDKKLEGLIVPIRVKSIEECIQLKKDFKPRGEKLTIEYKPFTRMPKSFRQMYMESDDYRKGITESTYFQVCKLDSDENAIERNKYRERLFNILIHFDMDYKTDDGLSLWEDAGLAKNNYDGLINIFSDIIKYEEHLDILDLVIDQVKNGNTDENSISSIVFQYGIRKTIEAIEDEEERKAFIENYTKLISEAQERLKNISEQKEEEKVDE